MNMTELDEKGFAFLDRAGRPYLCAMWGGNPWLFFWHPDKKWVSLRQVSQFDIWKFPKNLTTADRDIYWDEHNKSMNTHHAKLPHQLKGNVTPMELNLKIKQRREYLGLSQSDLAKKTGLTPACICQVEKGKRTPSLDSFRRIAMGLNTTMDSLYNGERHEFNSMVEFEERIRKSIDQFRTGLITKGDL